MSESVTYGDIHKAIVTRVKSNFGNIGIYSTDSTENIVRPSFQISFDNIRSTDFMGSAMDRTLTVRLYYFSTTENNNKVELLKTQDKLENSFLQDNIINVIDEFNVDVEELTFDTIDKVLHCNFELRMSEDYNRIDTTETMEELESNI